MMLHVDDINGLFNRDGIERGRVKKILETRFDKLKEQTGDNTNYVGMDVFWNRQLKQYEIGMTKYIEKVAKRFNIEVGVSNPNTSRTRCKDEEMEPANDSEYRSLVGALRYCAMLVKPAALYPITMLSVITMTLYVFSNICITPKIISISYVGMVMTEHFI